MEQFTVEVYLHREGDNLIVHSITHTDNTEYCANGHSPIPTSLNAEGELEIGLLIHSDENLPNQPFNTPVVHTLRFDTSSIVSSGSPLDLKVTVSHENEIVGLRKIGEGAGGNTPTNTGSKPITSRV